MLLQIKIPMEQYLFLPMVWFLGKMKKIGYTSSDIFKMLD